MPHRLRCRLVLALAALVAPAVPGCSPGIDATHVARGEHFPLRIERTLVLELVAGGSQALVVPESLVPAFARQASVGASDGMRAELASATVHSTTAEWREGKRQYHVGGMSVRLAGTVSVDEAAAPGPGSLDLRLPVLDSFVGAHRIGAVIVIDDGQLVERHTLAGGPVPLLTVRVHASRAGAIGARALPWAVASFAMLGLFARGVALPRPRAGPMRTAATFLRVLRPPGDAGVQAAGVLLPAVAMLVLGGALLGADRYERLYAYPGGIRIHRAPAWWIAGTLVGVGLCDMVLTGMATIAAAVARRRAGARAAGRER